MYWDLVQLIGCWLDGGRSECEFVVNCEKGVGFMQTKWLEKSSIGQQRSLSFSSEDQVMTLEKNYELKITNK